MTTAREKRSLLEQRVEVRGNMGGYQSPDPTAIVTLNQRTRHRKETRMFRGNSFVLSAIVGILLLTLSGTAQSDIPKTISYQGRVTDSGGTPVADGNYTMRFFIYDAVTGGAILWDSSAQPVNVSNGIFNVLLGESPQPMMDLDFDQDYWLLVRFAGIDQIPRQRLASVGYAYMASGLVAGTEVIGSVSTGTSSAIKATNTATTSYRNGVFGESHSTAGRGVYGYASATTGTTYGGVFQSSSPSGTGVYGAASSYTGTTYGVYGYTPSENGRGVYGFASATSGTTFGGRFESSSQSGTAVRGDATASTGTTFGIYGRSLSSSGSGVYGLAQASTGATYGGYFESISSSGKGVYGVTTAATGVAYGVYGASLSESGYGLYGITYATTGSTRGVYGHVYSTGGYGVYGHASALTGNTRAVFGQCHSNSGRGVYGYAISPAGYTYGVYGRSDSPSRGHGVYGEATATTGYTYGVYGTSYSTDGKAVYGHATAGTGVTYGVFGTNDSTEGYGVEGRANASTGAVYGVSGAAWSLSGYGVYGYHGSGGYGVYSSGAFGASGSKSCVVKTTQGPTALYCQESPECWFEDFGEGQLVYGRCHIELDPLFLETVTIDAANPMKVFLQPQDPECEGLAAIPSTEGFDAVELRKGMSDGRFTYRVVAKRKGFEEKRLDYCKAAETDSYLYPELREKEVREREDERSRRESPGTREE